MFNVFKKNSAEKQQVRLSDGRIMTLEELVVDYERLLREKTPKKAVPQELKVGEWFLIDRDVIDQNQLTLRNGCLAGIGLRHMHLRESFRSTKKCFVLLKPNQHGSLSLAGF